MGGTGEYSIRLVANGNLGSLTSHKHWWAWPQLLKVVRELTTSRPHDRPSQALIRFHETQTLTKEVRYFIVKELRAPLSTYLLILCLRTIVLEAAYIWQNDNILVKIT